MERKWVLRQDLQDPDRIKHLQDEFRKKAPAGKDGSPFELDYYRALLFLLRGIDSYAAASYYLNPSHKQLHNPFQMKGLERAVDRLKQAVENRERIMVYGDYDVDGTTSVAMVYSFLKRFVPEVFPYIPDRFKEGYGISFKGINAAEVSGCSVIVALDCGIKAHQQAVLAHEKGLDLIICDHHTPGEDVPPAFSVIDPKQEGCDYPFDELSGCAIGFKLLQGLSEKLLHHYKLPNQYLDLVAISIASDIVPMRGENRLLAKLGLEKIEKKPLIGVKALKDVSGLGKNLDIPDVVFKLGPRLNAAGRLDSAMDAFRLLASEDPEYAERRAGEVNTSNQRRKNYDEEITEEAARIIQSDPNHQERYTFVLHNPEWHKGVIGIVASRIVERFHRPVILLTESNGLLTGSARSIPGFDLYTAINRCTQYLEAFGGHKAAAGLSLKKENLGAFTEAFEEAVSNRMDEELLTPVVEYDMEVPLRALTPAFCRSLRRMGPFGPENMRPIFVSRNVQNVYPPRKVGNKDLHLKMTLGQRKNEKISAIGFKMGDYADLIQPGKPFDICYVIEENHFNGTLRYELNIKDIRVKE